MYKYKFLQAGQLPREHLSFLQNLLNFFITKYLKQVDDDLSIWVDKRSSCGLYNWRYKDLSMSRDQKVMALLSLMEKFGNSSSSVTRDNLSYNYELVTSLLPEVEYPMESFQWSLAAAQIWCS